MRISMEMSSFNNQACLPTIPTMSGSCESMAPNAVNYLPPLNADCINKDRSFLPI
jgi:hypothetical protein